MQLVRQIQFKRSPLLEEITFRSKNLFNVATYTIRQRFFQDRYWIRYPELWQLLRKHEAYLKLETLCGSHPPQQVLKQVDQNFTSFFKAIKVWKANPSKFTGRPRLPGYKRKKGKNVVYFTSLQVRNREGYLLLPRKIMRLGFPKISTGLGSVKVKGVRIVPFGDRYQIELVYNYAPQDLSLDKQHVIGIDLGLINLVTLSDNRGGDPLLIKGGALKSINQFYNKQLAKYKSWAKTHNQKDLTARMLALHRKRNNKVRDFFHHTSRSIINHCIDHNIGTIVIGYNEGWKQGTQMGKRNNQNFVSIPFLKLLQQIEYKAEMVGITVIRVSEAYTSQTCSCCGVVRKANRKHRGLYVCSTCGIVLNADVNASRNILHKGVPQSIKLPWIGDRGCLSHPVVLKV